MNTSTGLSYQSNQDEKHDDDCYDSDDDDTDLNGPTRVNFKKIKEILKDYIKGMKVSNSDLYMFLKNQYMSCEYVSPKNLQCFFSSALGTIFIIFLNIVSIRFARIIS